MSYNCTDFVEEIARIAERIGHPLPNTDDLAMQSEHFEHGVIYVATERDRLRDMLEKLIEWNAEAGGSEARVWSRARALYRLSGATSRPVVPDSQQAGPELIEKARCIYASDSDSIAIDDDAKRSESNDESGTWVSAWVWVQE